MRLFLAMTLTALLASAFGAVPAAGQDSIQVPTIRVYVSGGLEVPALGLADVTDYGYHFSAAAGFIPFPTSREVELQLQGFAAFFPAQNSFFNKHSIIGGGLNVKLSIYSLTPPFPYLVGGAGLAHVLVSPPESGPRSDNPEFTENHPFLNGGVGLDWPTGNRLSWFVEGKLMGISGGYLRDYIYFSASIGLRY